MDISRGFEEQWQHGHSVARGTWQPGDPVFFKNAFEHGVFEVGSSIRKETFIHAENEETGIAFSSIAPDYSSQHYAGARRLL